MKERMNDQTKLHRRDFLCGAGALVASTAAPFALAESRTDPWQRAQQIAERCSRPLTFRKEDFPVTAFGAKTCQLVAATSTWRKERWDVKTPAPGSHDCYPAISAAITACHKAGGGRVLVPAGSWYCKGPIVLRSNVHEHPAAGAQLYVSAKPCDYA